MNAAVRAEAALTDYLRARQPDAHTPVTLIDDPALVERVLSIAGPHLDPDQAADDITQLYVVGWHWSTQSLVIASRGAVLYCHAPRSQQAHLVFHRGLAIYRPGLGVEMVNVGLVGDVYGDEVIVRAESACSPSFLFGSQRCNCHHQWQCVQELAARLNPVTAPAGLHDGPSFERWVQGQVQVADNKVRFAEPGARGLVMLHLDCQNGMGSGYTPGEFVEDLYTRASLRHRGEYASEQVFGASMAGAFRSIGIEPDPRHLDDGIGYQTPFIALDFLGVSQQLALLSNNPLKWSHPLAERYQIRPVALAGAVNLAGAEEAGSRHAEFGHSLQDTLIDFDSELERLTRELTPR